jgi:hypothetical protein
VRARSFVNFGRISAHDCPDLPAQPEFQTKVPQSLPGRPRWPSGQTFLIDSDPLPMRNALETKIEEFSHKTL